MPAAARRCSAPRPTSTPSSRASGRSPRPRGPAFRSLGETVDVGTQGLQASRSEEIAELRELAQTRPRLAKPLRQFLQTLDDRKRAIENDPRAKDTAPPAPDPTAIPGQGRASPAWRRSSTTSTGRRSASTCSTTSAHMLRASLTASADCIAAAQRTPPRTRRTRSSFKRCNSYLGPNQPGITSARPDPTTAPTRTPRAARRERQAGERLGERARRGPARGRPAARPARPVASRRSRCRRRVQDLLDALTPAAPRLRRPPQPGQLRSSRAAPAPPVDDRDHRPAPRLPARAMRRRRGQHPRRQPGAGRRRDGADRDRRACSSPTTRTPACRSSPPTTSTPSCPSGAKLVKGNEVRVGGFRVGVVEDIKPERHDGERRARSVAVADLKLDKKVEPLGA